MIDRKQAHQLLAVKGGDNRPTPAGQPGPDIEKLRKQRKRLRWDAKTVEMALNRYYPTRQHAIKGEAQDRRTL